MQFSTLALSALAMGGALAQDMVRTHVVRVGSVSGDLTFMPSTLAASAGDMVQFQFAPKNHSVAQSTFDQPCQPSRLHSNVTGLWSGYMAVAPGSEMTTTWTVRVNDTKPLWLYCSQGRHCQNGMVMVINPPAANRSRTFESYKALAATSPVNLGGDGLPAGAPSNGTTPGTGNNNNPGSGSGSGNGNTGGSPTDGSSPTGTDGSASRPTNTGAAASVRVGGATTFAGVLAIAFAALL